MTMTTRETRRIKVAVNGRMAEEYATRRGELDTETWWQSIVQRGRARATTLELGHDEARSMMADADERARVLQPDPDAYWRGLGRAYKTIANQIRTFI